MGMGRVRACAHAECRTIYLRICKDTTKSGGIQTAQRTNGGGAEGGGVWTKETHACKVTAPESHMRRTHARAALEVHFLFVLCCARVSVGAASRPDWVRSLLSDSAGERARVRVHTHTSHVLPTSTHMELDVQDGCASVSDQKCMKNPNAMELLVLVSIVP